VDFIAFNLVHMAKEEDIINNLLWRYYTEDKYAPSKDRSYQTKHLSQRLLLEMDDPGLSTAKSINWLKTVEKNAPQIVFKNLFLTAVKGIAG
jgi:hypothetical protein